MTRLSKTVFYVFVLVGAANSQVVSANPGTMKRVLDDVSVEYATCAAYFEIVVGAVFDEDADTNTLKQQYSQVAHAAREKAIVIAQVFRSRELAEKITKSRVEMAAKSMLDDIGNDLANVEILISEHLEACKRTMDDPSTVLDEKYAEAMHGSTD
tara:strand:- start:2390 stop:2854 length:465 start_codon:yes stop_codon:yes gene_type:complete